MAIDFHCARSPVDRTLASGAESVGSTPAERTIKNSRSRRMRDLFLCYIPLILPLSFLKARIFASDTVFFDMPKNFPVSTVFSPLK